MTPLDVLIELLDRVAANRGDAVLISEEELRQWPPESVRAMKGQNLIKKARPAASAVCTGCEHECMMPVETMPGKTGGSVSFVVCEKRNDINRVPVPTERLTQWQSNPELLCGFIAENLEIRRSNRQPANTGIMEIGIASGNKRSQMLGLQIEGELTLVAGDSKLPLVEVMDYKADRYFIDNEMVYRLIDSATTTDKRYTPSNARREVRKLETQDMYESWKKAYREMKKTRPNMSEVWYSQQIARTDIAQGRDSETIRKNMK